MELRGGGMVVSCLNIVYLHSVPIDEVMGMNRTSMSWNRNGALDVMSKNVHKASTHAGGGIVVDVALHEGHCSSIDVDTSSLPKQGIEISK